MTRKPSFMLAVADLLHNHRDTKVLRLYRKSNPQVGRFASIKIKRKERANIFKNNKTQLRLVASCLLQKYKAREQKEAEEAEDEEDEEEEEEENGNKSSGSTSQEADATG